MSWTQRVVLFFASKSRAAAIEAESRRWVMRCDCGRETSVWEMGGVRYGAAGNPVRAGKCVGCGKAMFGTLYKVA